MALEHSRERAKAAVALDEFNFLIDAITGAIVIRQDPSEYFGLTYTDMGI